MTSQRAGEMESIANPLAKMCCLYVNEMCMSLICPKSIFFYSVMFWVAHDIRT